MPMQCFIPVKVNLEKKKGSSYDPNQKCDDFTTPYYPFFAPLSVKWSLKGS